MPGFHLLGYLRPARCWAKVKQLRCVRWYLGARLRGKMRADTDATAAAATARNLIFATPEACTEAVYKEPYSRSN